MGISGRPAVVTQSAAGDPTILDSAEPAVSSAVDDPLAPPEGQRRTPPKGQWTEHQASLARLLRHVATLGKRHSKEHKN